MPHLSARGDVAHGVGGGYFNINNVAILVPGTDRRRMGGAGGWIDDDVAAFVDGEGDRWVPASYDRRTGAVADLPGAVGANIAFAGGGVAAWWFGSPTDARGIYATTDFRARAHAAAVVDGKYDPSKDVARNGGLMGVGYDGAIGYKPDYHSGGPTLVRERDGSDWKLTDGHAAGLQLLGQRRAIWQEVWSVRVANLPTPVLAVTEELWAPEAAFAGGAWWIVYFSSKHGITLHPFGSFDGFSVLAKGDGWHTIRALDTHTIRIAIATRQGQQAGELWVRDYDVVKNLVRDPWGSKLWTPAARVDVRTINQTIPITEPPPVLKPPPLPEPPPMAEPQSIVSFVHAERAKYPEIITFGTGARIIGDAAIAADKAGFPGWGHSVKPGGNNVELPDGVKVAYDIMMNRLYAPPNDLYDVFLGQEEGDPFRGIVTWGQAHPHNASDRPWHAPIGAAAPGTPVDPGAPGTPPSGIPALINGAAAVAIALAEVLEATVERVNLLEAEVASLEARLEALPAGGGSVTLPEVVGIQSVSKGAFLRHDHGDNLGHFDRPELGDGEKFRLVVP